MELLLAQIVVGLTDTLAIAKGNMDMVIVETVLAQAGLLTVYVKT